MARGRIEERRRYAPWWRRAVAFVIDGFAVGVVDAAVGLGFAAPGFSYALAAVLLSPIACIAYFTLSHGSRSGQTLGDRALEIAVRNDADGGRLTYGQAFGRTLMVMLFAAFWFMGGVADFLWPLWDRRRQAWHDKVAGTVVVQASQRR